MYGNVWIVIGGDLVKVPNDVGGFTPTPHPVMLAPTPQQIKNLVAKMGLDAAIAFLQTREDKILAEKLDPYRHGYEPQCWNDADAMLEEFSELLILGGNRAGKTEYMAKRAVDHAVNNPEARIWCLHTTHQSSIGMQQNVVWKYMPPEFKMLKKSKYTNISYTQKNGFSESTAVFPNRSQMWFLNYAQDRKVIEGGECDLIWCDELVPLDWIETLRYRTVTRRGRLVVTFTPITGYTQVVKSFVAGCRIIDSRPSVLLARNVNVAGCPGGHMPYRFRCHRPNAGGICFHSDMNPYSPFDSMRRTLAGRSPHEIKIRAYGWAEALAGSQFPKFGEVNIVPPERIPTEGTNYMAMDPAGARNWFILWGRVDEHGRLWIYREWPDISVGEWSLPSDKVDGKPGVGQTNGAGRSIIDYKELMRELEKDEEIAERYIDPRAGSTQAAGKEGGTSLIELLEDDPDPMTIIPSAGIRIEEGVALINDRLAWDSTQPLSVLNEPKLYISSDCQNLIYSLREWTGADGDKGASKDPIDALRYIVVMDPQHHSTQAFASSGGGSY